MPLLPVASSLQAKLINNIPPPIKNANVTQEGLKGSTKELSDHAVAEFNEIYAQATAICKITAKLFKSDPIKKDKFTFAKLTSDLNVHKPAKAKISKTDA